MSFILSSWRGKREKKEEPWWDSTLERHAQKPCEDAPGLPACATAGEIFVWARLLIVQCHRCGLSSPQLEECIYGP